MGKQYTPSDVSELLDDVPHGDRDWYINLMQEAAENKILFKDHVYKGPEKWRWLWLYYLAFFGEVRKTWWSVSGRYMATLVREQIPQNLRDVPRWLTRISRHFYFWVALAYLMLVGVCVSGVICGWVPLLNLWTIAGIAVLAGISYIYSQGLKKGILMQVHLKKTKRTLVKPDR